MFGMPRSFLILLLLCSQTLAVSFYISSSCYAFPKFGQAWNEAFIMAKVSSERLANQPPDPDIEFAFHRIFNTPTANDQARREVYRILSGVTAMTFEPVRERADVRIYCDEDARWTLQPDREPVPSVLYDVGEETKLYRNGYLIPNSQREPDDQVWIDRTNGMLYRGGDLHCHETAAQMFPQSNMAYDGVQKPGRVTFTFCRPYTEQRTPTVAALLNEQVDLGQQRMSYPPLDGLLSVTVLHELTHIPAFDTEDVDYYWDNVISMSTAQGLKNAESYAFFGLTAVLGLAGYRLDPKSRSPEIGALVRTPYVWHRGRARGREVLPELGYTAYRAADI